MQHTEVTPDEIAALRAAIEHCENSEVLLPYDDEGTPSPTLGHLRALLARLTALVIETIGGQCPVQAEGTIDGAPFYFRARGNRWSIGVGGEPVLNPSWRHEEPYGDEPYAAGYMSEQEARAFIEQAATLYRAALAAAETREGRDA